MREGYWTKGEGDNLSYAVVNMNHGYTDRQVYLISLFLFFESKRCRLKRKGGCVPPPSKKIFLLFAIVSYQRRLDN
jgi:hypothetical protein